MMKIQFNKTKTAIIALILTLTLSAIMIGMPVRAQRTINLRWVFSHEVIGVNQPIVMCVTPSASRFASVYGVEWGQMPTSRVYVWPDAYVVFTRPDGTTDTLQGPFLLGVAHRPFFEYVPDMVGTWEALFVWPGDEYYEPATVKKTFTVQQQPVSKRTTWAMLSLKPYPAVGLGQSLLINAWITPAPFTQAQWYEDYSFTFTSPTGSSFTVGPLDSEGPGTVWFDLPLTEVGDWTIKFEFPGDIHNKPASVTRTITVQDEWVPVGYPDTPLPTEEWRFPINVQNREWRTIAGPWYETMYNASAGAYNPYTEAPRAAHILWKLDPVAGMGGYVGSPHSIETGSGEDVYGAGDEGIFSSTIATIETVMAGRGYYTAAGNIHCVDIQTGEELWEVPGSFNVGATRARTPVLYQFGSTFRVYNAWTGELMLEVPGMSMMDNWFEDPYVYSVQGSQSREMEYGTVPGTEEKPDLFLIKWDTGGTTKNFTERIVWKVSIPDDIRLPSRWSSTMHAGLVIFNDVDAGQGIIRRTVAFNTTTGEEVYHNNLLEDTYSDPDNWYNRMTPVGSGQGLVFRGCVSSEDEGLGYVAFNASTGKLAWVSEQAAYPWGNFWHYMPIPNAYGMIYAGGYPGVYAFNVTNGKIVWHYIAEDSYYEEPYSSNIDPKTGEFFSSYSFGSVGSIVGGGIVFAPSTEHSPTFIYRGQALHAIDAFTGEGLWTIKGVYEPSAIAYGILLASDSYNGFTYAFGKGSTETTLSVQNDVITYGSSVLLKGTVLDLSPAQKGTAAIADEFMTPWMEYLHMQQPCPADAEGVEVVLTTLDPNGNTYEIGRATSDASGMFSLLWEPPVPGKYTIIATFEGSESYYASYAETAIGVEEAPSPAVPIEPEPTTPAPTESTLTEPEPTEAEPAELTPTEPQSTEIAEAPLITTEVAIIAAVSVAVVIGIVAYWALRKRK